MKRSLCGIAAALGVAVAAPSGAAPVRQETLAVLESIRASAGPGIQVWVNQPGTGAEIDVGEPISIHFRSERDAHLTALYVDSHGVTTVLSPTGDPEAALIHAGQEKTLPPVGGGYRLEAKPPLGEETILVVATEQPISLADLGLTNCAQLSGDDAPPGGFTVVEADRAPELARRLQARTQAKSTGAVLAGRTDHRIVQRVAAGEPQYPWRGIVRYFTERQRTIRRPKLDLDIKFEFDSATLTADARRDLDEVGKALQDPALRGSRFLLEGHTDDVGEDAYNLGLSEKRAQASKQYLTEKHAVDPSRLAAEGHGESQPLVAATDDWARSMNRRVVLELSNTTRGGADCSR
jgi:outer membrane protein OmpA-like peptidoglycan-associated protein